MADSAQLYGGQPESFVVEQAATAPIVGKKTAESWLDFEHPRFTRMKPKWKIVKDFYSGEVADQGVTAREYLIQRFQGEGVEQFNERVKIADYTPHLGTLVDSIAGMLFAVDDRASRVWTDENGNGGLGDPAKQDTPAHSLWLDADGKGSGWVTLWRQFTIDVMLYEYMWVLVDTVGDRHRVKLISPTCVPNWVDGTNGPVSVLMTEAIDTRTSVTDTTTASTGYIQWSTDGFQRYTKDEDGTPVKTTGQGGSGAYRYVDRDGVLTLPIFRIELPLRRYVTWILAKKAAVLFNAENVRDFGQRASNFSKLVLGVVGEQLEELENRLLKGSNVLPEDKEAAGSHRYINSPSEPVAAASETLKSKVEDFWASGFKMYGDAAREKTATEIKQDVAAGVGAFLQLLKAAVDDAENGALFRLEQAEYSESEDKWGIAHVERADDFSSVDLNAILDQMRKRYLGDTDPIPVGRSALIQLAKEAARVDGLPVKDEEIEAAVDAASLAKVITNLELLGVTPALVKARLAMKLVAVTGLINPKELIKMSSGEERMLLDVLTEQSVELAEVAEESMRRQAELPPPGSIPPL